MGEAGEGNPSPDLWPPHFLPRVGGPCGSGVQRSGQQRGRQLRFRACGALAARLVREELMPLFSMPAAARSAHY